MDTYKTADICTAAYLNMRGAELVNVKKSGTLRQWSFKLTLKCKGYVYDFLESNPKVDLWDYILRIYRLESNDKLF